MNSIIKKEQYKGYTICIISDDSPENPRTEFDNLGTMVCWHKRYKLGDEQPEIGLDEYLCNIAGLDYDYVRPDNKRDMEIVRAAAKKIAVILPVYMLDHSGLTLSTTSFNDRWDSGLLGLIFVKRDNEEIKGMTDEQVSKYLTGEVETYSAYLSGNVYGYEISYNADDNHIDACWGYYGNDFEKSDILPQARTVIDETIKRQLREHFKQVKAWIRNKVPHIYRQFAL